MTVIILEARERVIGGWLSQAILTHIATDEP